MDKSKKADTSVDTNDVPLTVTQAVQNLLKVSAYSAADFVLTQPLDETTEGFGYMVRGVLVDASGNPVRGHKNEAKDPE